MPKGWGSLANKPPFHISSQVRNRDGTDVGTSDSWLGIDLRSRERFD